MATIILLYFNLVISKSIPQTPHPRALINSLISLCFKISFLVVTFGIFPFSGNIACFDGSLQVLNELCIKTPDDKAKL